MKNNRQQSSVEVLSIERNRMRRIAEYKACVGISTKALEEGVIQEMIATFQFLDVYMIQDVLEESELNSDIVAHNKIVGILTKLKEEKDV